MSDGSTRSIPDPGIAEDAGDPEATLAAALAAHAAGETTYAEVLLFPARRTAHSAVHEEAAALLVDVAGPVRFVVDDADLHALASGRHLVRAGTRVAWIRPKQERSANL